MSVFYFIQFRRNTRDHWKTIEEFHDQADARDAEYERLQEACFKNGFPREYRRVNRTISDQVIED